MKNYIILSLVSIILMIVATSAMIVAVGLLTHETIKFFVVVCNFALDSAIVLKESWEFVRSVGVF